MHNPADRRELVGTLRFAAAEDVDAAVAAIIADVRARGDRAVLELTARFDRLDLTVSAGERIGLVGENGPELVTGPATI